MKRYRNIITALAITLALILSGSVTVLAESNEYEGSCVYNGKTIDSDFTSASVARAVEDLQPGDEVTFAVTFTNADKDKTDWYMENSIVQTLEKTTAKKKVSGTGKAENGGYTYELIHYDKDGEEDVLFSNEKVGGENGKMTDPKNSDKELEGLEPATNALDDWFFIETLDQDEEGMVVLRVAFDGETEVNDYMDTDGELNLRFAVEKETEPGPPIKTGDQSRLIMWSAICLVSGTLLLVLAWLMRRKRGGNDEKA